MLTILRVYIRIWHWYTCHTTQNAFTYTYIFKKLKRGIWKLELEPIGGSTKIILELLWHAARGFSLPPVKLNVHTILTGGK